MTLRRVSHLRLRLFRGPSGQPFLRTYRQNKLLIPTPHNKPTQAILQLPLYKSLMRGPSTTAICFGSDATAKKVIGEVVRRGSDLMETHTTTISRLTRQRASAYRQRTTQPQ